MNAPSKTVNEFFAGMGLMRLGLELSGWKTVFANDIDDNKEQLYTDHFGQDKTFVLGDVHKLDVQTVPASILATASFPCNDLSLAGARAGLAGTHSSAFWGFMKIVREMGKRKPRFILLENVTGFLTSNDGNDFRQVLDSLNELGYSVDAFIIDAARFVPQSRQRLFVIGVLDKQSEAIEINDTPRFYESDCRPAALADFILWNCDIRWRIRPLPPLPECHLKVVDIVEQVSQNSKLWWSAERCDYLFNQMSPKHQELTKRMIAGSELSYATVFRRVRNDRSMAEVRKDGIAGCLRTPRGGSGRQIIIEAGKGRFAVRLLTPRECSRLMGAPDFTIKVGQNQALFGFGDAVCVPVIQWIGDNYLNPLFNEAFVDTTPRTKPGVVSYRKGAAKH